MKILIATDGSKQADAAIEASAKFVKSVAQIKIISVVAPRYPIAAEPFAASAEFYAEVEANERKNANETVTNAVAKLQDLFADKKPEISGEVLNGNPSQMIVEKAEQYKADLIVVGSHGYGFWQRTLLGSVSDAVIHHAPCSILVVRESK